MTVLKKLMSIAIKDLNKTILSSGFALCIVITFCLCFTSVIYTDSTTGQEYAVIQILLNMSDFRYSNLDAADIFRFSVDNYLTIFLPILSALPYVTFFCAERISGCMRFGISRSGKLRYYTAKFISAILSGGLAVMTGYSLYGIIIYIMFPTGEASLTEFAQLVVGMALYGMISVLPAFFLSAFIKNKYIICCLPFIIMHFYFTLLSRIQSMFINKDRFDLVFKMDFLYPNNIRNILIKDSNSLLILLFYSFLSAISFIGFYIIMSRRFDCGE